jgi:hypothetical protein
VVCNTNEWTKGNKIWFWSQDNLHEWKRQLVRKDNLIAHIHVRHPERCRFLTNILNLTHSFIHSPTPKNLQTITCTSMAAMISVTNKQYLYPAHIPWLTRLHLACSGTKLAKTWGICNYPKRKEKIEPKTWLRELWKPSQVWSPSWDEECFCHATIISNSPSLPFPSLSLCWFWGIISIHDHNRTSRPFI